MKMHIEIIFMVRDYLNQFFKSIQSKIFVKFSEDIKISSR